MSQTAPIEIYGIGVDVPDGYLDKIMDAIDAVIDPISPDYGRAFRYYPVKGTWRSGRDSHPFDGRPGEITIANEMRLEFIVKKKDLALVLETIRKVHPYEEPAIDVIPQYEWSSVLNSCP